MDVNEGSLRTKDDRGRTVSMLDPYTLHLLRRHDAIPTDALAVLAADLGSGLTRITRFLFVLGIVCVVPGVIAFVVHLIAIIKAGGMVWPLPWWLLVANVWIVPFVLWVAAGQARARSVRSVMIKHLRCPHCGYDLRMLQADPTDGATTCPECGCAWRLSEYANADSA